MILGCLMQVIRYLVLESLLDHFHFENYFNSENYFSFSVLSGISGLICFVCDITVAQKSLPAIQWIISLN